MSPANIIVDQRDWEQVAQERTTIRRLARHQSDENPVFPTTTESAKLKEGAYFLGHDDVIYRHFKDGDRLVMAPKNTPAFPENKVANTSDKRERYQRIMLLIRMRETVKSILHLQEEYSDEVVEGMDEAPWVKHQEDLKQLYESFTHNFGPLNKYEWRKAGELDDNGNRTEYKIRTNLKKFRKDPDAYLVAAIEDFDEETQEAKPGAIFTERVLRARSGQPALSNMKQALAYCLDERTVFDINFMQSLLPSMTADEIIDDLRKQKLIFLDSETQSYVTKEEFLSGDIAQKLNISEAEEEKALKRALPKILKPEDINLSLGMPWIPKELIQDFAENELGLTGVEIDYVPQSHTWFVSSQIFDYMTAEYDYGTSVVDAGELLERALNNREVAFRKRTDENGSPLDREKEKKLATDRKVKIEDRFQEWIWEDKARSSLVQQIYNENFNATVPRDFDGSHISFAGSSTTIDLQPHQRNGVARDINSPTTLLEWDVGAGKTFGSIAALMEGKRHNRFKKPMMVVQNHLLGEFSRDFMKLYPNANILVVEEDQLVDHGENVTSDEKVRKLVDKASQHDWDAIIITKSNFDRMHISPERKLRILINKIDDLEEIKEQASDQNRHWRIHDHLNNLIEGLKKEIVQYLKLEEGFEDEGSYDRQIKTAIHYLDTFISKDFSAAEWQDCLKAKKAENPASFEELGVDKLYVDEAHDYKNLTIKSRIPDVAKAGSTKADSFKEKLSYLREINPDNYLTMLTATPVLNSLMEFYVFQQYLQPDTLEKYGIDDPDAWISMFGELVEDIELAPETGYYRTVKRLAAYNNIPELMRFYRSCSDVMTREDIDLDLPELVNAEGEVTGKPQIIEIPENPSLTFFFKELLQRAIEVRGGNVSPAEDNILKIINEARLATLDPRLVGWEENKETDTKISVSANEIAKRYHANKERIYYTDETQTHEDPLPGSLQMVLCNQGIPKGDGTFSVYEELKNKLIDQGIPKENIAFIHEHDSDKKKEELFKKCRTGEISVLIGTTQKLGTGTNVQKRLIALHELDAPWRPGDVIQGRGRIERQKNQNPHIEILTYIQEGSFDIYNWQMLERKARFIAQAKIGASNRSFNEEDAFTAFCEGAKNTAANDGLLAEKALLLKELTPLEASRKSRQNERKRSKSRLKVVREEIKDLKDELKDLKAQENNAKALVQSEKPFTIDGHEFRRSIRAGKQLKKSLRKIRKILKDTLDNSTNSLYQGLIGSYFGIDMSVSAELEVAEKAADENGKVSRDYKYKFTITLDTPEPIEIPIPNEEIQESRLEKEFEKAARDHDALKQTFGSTAEIRSKRRELTSSFNKIIERIAKPFTSYAENLRTAKATLDELQQEEKKLVHIVDSKFEYEGRYQYLSRRRREIDKKLLERNTEANDNLHPDLALHDIEVG